VNAKNNIKAGMCCQILKQRVTVQTAKLTAEELEAGYWRAYREFYSWKNIRAGACASDSWRERLRHAAYAGGWKKFEPLWDAVIRAKRATTMLPTLEAILSGFGAHASGERASARSGFGAAVKPEYVPKRA
jgi:hypothetical protein